MQKEMIDALNTQVNKELYSAYLYLGMVSYFEEVNLKGFAAWMRMQSQEEIMHAMKIYNHVLERGGKAKLLAIDEPPQAWKSPLEIFQAAYEHEQKVTKMINDLVTLAVKLNDYATQNFLQWFVAEQVEEESSVSEVVERLKLAGDKSGLLFLDAELGKRSAPSTAEE
ncbi:MAG: ferritin [Gammaproteobacteria bacterium]